VNNVDNADLIILGGGPAGYHAALVAVNSGLRVSLFEAKRLGGTCLNEGCIPSKSLLHTAKVFEYGKNSTRYGVMAEEVKIDHQSAMKSKDRIVRALVQSISDSLKKQGVNVIPEKAVISGKEDGLFCVRSENHLEKSSKLLICTGSESAFPPIEGLDEALENGFAITSTDILSLSEVPERLLVLGGGIIGLEMAQYYSAAGSSVKVIEMLDHIGGSIDIELSQILKRELEKRGIDFLLEVQVKAINGRGLEVGTDKGIKLIEGDKVLICTGRKPRINNMGFESIGLDISGGRIITNDHMEANVDGVYAAGDVNGRSMLAHTAYREAEVAVSNILGKKETMKYNAIPSVIYTNPEVAWVGETEDRLTEKGKDFVSIKLPMMLSGRYAVEGGTPRGIIKCSKDRATNTLLGVHAIGNGASEFIFGAVMAIENGITTNKLGKTVFPHPTVGEILRESFNLL
jgi:dihydrolipoamide dehydrogenase